MVTPPSRRNGASDVACLSRAISGARARIPGRTGILGYDDTARKALVAHYSYIRQRIGRAVLEHPDVEATPELVRRVDLAIEASGAILDTRMLFWWDRADADWDQVADEVELLFLRVSGLG